MPAATVSGSPPANIADEYFLESGMRGQTEVGSSAKKEKVFAIERKDTPGGGSGCHDG